MAMDADAETELAGWLAEAFETGNALAPCPASHLPADTGQGERVAAAVLGRLDMAPCGVRWAPGPQGHPIAGPMLEGRLLSPSTPVALTAVRHPRASAAIIAVLAQPLTGQDDGPPAIARLHPAIDIAGGRLRSPHDLAGMQAADLGGLGLVVAARRGVAAPDLAVIPVTLAAPGRRPRPQMVALAAGLGAAAASARRLGGLPAGALLVLAGLSPARVPEPGMRLSAGFGPLGRVAAIFV